MTESTAFPWLKHLPEDAAREFFEELHTQLLATATFTPVKASAESYAAAIDPMIHAWKATAEVHADPELYRALTQDHSDIEGDFVEVTWEDAKGAFRPTDGAQLPCPATTGCVYPGECAHGCRWAADELTRLGQEMELPEQRKGEDDHDHS